MKKFFGFSLFDYLKVFCCYAVFLSIFYFSANALSFSSSKLLTAEAGASDAFLIFFLFIGLLALNFLSYTFLTMVAYLTAAGKKLGIKLWPRYMLSFVLMALIFTIPVLFFMRLLSDGNPAALLVFFITTVLMFHFFNLVYFFTALEGKVFLGIRKGFYFGTVKIRHLLLPYLVVAVLFVAASLLMYAVSIEFVRLVVIGLFLSFFSLYVGRKVMKHKKR